jgi:hypothetical protein
MGDMGEVRQLPAGRALFADARGVGMRVTWHLERGIVNLSIWREGRCVETFWLPVHDVARLVGFLVDGLAGAAAVGDERSDAGAGAATLQPG